MMRLLGLEAGFPLVPLVAYTPYVAAATIIPIGAALLLRRPAAAVTAAIAGACLIAVVAPRAISDGCDDCEGRELHLVTANIYRGEADLAELIDLVRSKKADVLALQELTPSAIEELDRLQIRSLLPYRVLVDGGQQLFSGGLYSRFPLRRMEPVGPVREISFHGRPLVMPRALVVLPEPSAPIEMTSVHPFPPVRDRVGDWKTGLRSLPRAGEGGPQRILLGDFNATLDHDELRDLLDSGYEDAAEAVGAGLTPTWNLGQLFPPPVTIDHIVVEDLEVIDYDTHDLSGSDHRTLSATLSLGPA